MSSVPLLEDHSPRDVYQAENSGRQQSPLPSHTAAEAHHFSQSIASAYMVDEFGRPLTPYFREKALKIRRANGATKLKRLSKKHLDMIQLHLKGWSGGAIAAHFGCSQATLSLVLSDPLSQEVIQRAHDDVKGEINALVIVATGVVRQALLEPSSHSVKMSAIDRLEKLHKMTGTEVGNKTAEDLVQELLARGGTVNVINGQNVQVNQALPGTGDVQLTGDVQHSAYNDVDATPSSINEPIDLGD